MKYRKYTICFIFIAIFLIALLPCLNAFKHGLTRDGGIKYFNADCIEKYVNYAIYKLFNRSVNQDQVITGDDGFLFLGNTYDAVLHKTNGVFQPSNDIINKWTDGLKKMQEFYKGMGIKFVAVIAPNKHTIYKDKLPCWMEYNGKAIADDVLEYAQKKNINLLDLRPILLSKKDDDDLLYYKTDTHWNINGSSIAVDATINYINKVYMTDIPRPEYELNVSYSHGGDLARFLKFDKVLGNNYEKVYRLSFDEIHRSGYKRSDLKVCFMCDSFGDAPVELIDKTFRKTWPFKYLSLIGHEAEFFTFIKRYRPDVVILQIVERKLCDDSVLILPRK